MTGKFILLVQPASDESLRIQSQLAEAGYRVMAVSSDDEAVAQLERLNFFPPDLLLTPLSGVPEGSQTIARLRENALTENVPVVVLSTGEADDRMQALRLGFQHVPPPHDGEELLLTVGMAIEQHRDDRLLTGTLSQLSVADLLQTLETTRRSGTVTFRDRGRTATLWLREGQIIDAEADGGLRGQEAVFALAGWHEGSFEAGFGPVSVPARMTTSTSFLLLEAMRRRDEAQRSESLPHAALPDPPPPPPPSVMAVHRALTLLAVTSSYAAEHLERPLLARRLEEQRQALLAEHPRLAAFQVGAEANVAVGDGLGEMSEIDVDELVLAVSTWLRSFFERTEKSLPGRFSIEKLRALTEAVRDDLKNLGFYRALGLDIEAEPDAEEETS